jgi:hypothetical protein
VTLIGILKEEVEDDFEISSQQALLVRVRA